MKYTDHVNVFQGNGEIDLPSPKGIAAKWFFIKAGCGNTNPAAVLPFGAMSVGPFTGGYPTGYGDHLPNSHSRPEHFPEGKKLIGFSHLHQSGTGAIGFYYNYAVVTPVYDTSEFRRDYKDEKAYPGYYSLKTEDILCELTVNERTALHRYSFGKNGGRVKIDFTNNGLLIPGQEKARVNELKIQKEDSFTVTAEAVIEGIRLYFAARCNNEVSVTEDEVSFSAPEDRISEIKLSISFDSLKAAIRNIESALSFDETRKAALKKWDEKLSLIKASFDDESLYEIFYSNLYHSLIKPSDWSGESFVYEKCKPFMTDFATLWDMYKTALPLIFMTDKKVSENICETLMSLGEALGNIPNGFGITDKFNEHSYQARMLGAYSLITAYEYGIDLDVRRMLNVIRTDIFADNKRDFTVDGRCASHTFMLDMADACRFTADIAKDVGDNELYELLMPLASQWRKVYSEETGLLLDDSEYYEGTKYNYSFRQMADMKERIEIAGGKEAFVRLLDDFFGYGKEDTVQPTDPHNYKIVEDGMKLGRFEGFNNESDTEAPFSYIYADRHDKTAEIIRAGMKYMFTSGRGGIPGNNDSGALSSYYVLNALGIYPLAGQKVFLIGSPICRSASISLSSGKTLNIEVNDNSEESIYVKRVMFNGKEIKDFRIPANDIMNGGTLIFFMSDKP
ncbi:MAG: glycoside hydrolase family 92 protein [Clostridia bacterium]|nr:glycoside hydrolase family 92 protein [Clostridia bacterium]